MTTTRDAQQQAAAELALVAEKCRWTERVVGGPRARVERPAEHASAHQRTLELPRAHVPRRADRSKVRFYFPDSQDLVSPSYDFLRDEYPAHRVRQRDDRYAHEVLSTARRTTASWSASPSWMDPSRVPASTRPPNAPASTAWGSTSSSDSHQASRRSATTARSTTLMKRFLRSRRLETLDFYEECGFDAGVSTDHVVFGFTEDPSSDDVNPDWEARRRLTLRLGRGVHLPMPRPPQLRRTCRRRSRLES